MPRFDELYVVSDLHIGGSKGFQIFQEGCLLGGFIAALAGEATEKAFRKQFPDARPPDPHGKLAPLPSPKSRVGLLFNGDIVDFLAEEPVCHLDVKGAIAKLKSITEREQFKPVFQALRSYLRQPGRELVLVLGNHDLELALPHVQEWLKQDLATRDDGVVDDAARGRITFATDGAGFRCMVGGATVLCVHGEIADDWNRVNHQGLRAIAHKLNQGADYDWNPNGGTRLVVDLMNDIKKKHPFVDLLKPEQEAMLPILCAIDPGTLRKLPGLIRPWLEKVQSEGSPERFLGGASTHKAAPDTEDAAQNVLPRAALGLLLAAPTSDDIFKQVEDDLKRGVDPSLAVLEEDGSEMLWSLADLYRTPADWVRKGKNKVAEWISTAEDEVSHWISNTEKGLSEWIGKTGERALLEALRRILRADHTFVLDQPDEPYQWATKNVVWSDKQESASDNHGVQFVIAGHTHLERWIKRDKGAYFNSGTWASLIKFDLKKLESEEAFKDIRKKLQTAKTVEDLIKANVAQAQPTVVAIRSEGGETMGALHTARRTVNGVRLEARSTERNGDA